MCAVCCARVCLQVRQGTGAEVEAFVHGALCVSYSGQCFSSEAWGGRSANRGQCAQACRLPYSLMVDGTIKVGCAGGGARWRMCLWGVAGFWIWGLLLLLVVCVPVGPLGCQCEC